MMELKLTMELAVRLLFTVHLFLTIEILLVSCNPVNDTCDVRKAEACAAEQQNRLDKEIVSFRIQSTVTNSTRDLCLSTIRNDDVTRCYYGNRNPCENKTVEFLTYQWQDSMDNTKVLCNEVCRGYEGFAVCEQKIQYNAINNSQWEIFCSSYNQSATCAEGLITNCQLGSQLYDVLMQSWAKPYYLQLCLTGCINLNETMLVIEDCWNQYGDGIKQNSTMCKSHNDFTRCLYLPDKVCREVNDLMPMFYDYDSTDEECRKRRTPEPTTTTTTTTTTPPTTTPTTTQATTQTTTQTTTASSVEPTTPTTSMTEKTTREKQTTLSRLTTQQKLLTTANEPTTGSTNSAVTSTFTTTSEVSTIYNRKDLPSRQKDCLKGQLLKLNTISDADIDVSLCSDIFSTLACIYNQSTAQKSSVQTQDNPVVLQEIVSSMILIKCSSVIETQREQYVQYLNSSCVQGNVQEEDYEDLPLCSGHTYGLIKCRNGAEEAVVSDLVTMLMVLIISCIVCL